MPNPIYATRCKCFKLSIPCTWLCRCLNCSNPYGARTATPQGKPTRSRRKHAYQVKLPASKKFAEDRGEAITQAIWSYFLTIVLEEVCCKEDDVDMNIATELYNNIQYYSTTTYCIKKLPNNIVFRKKTFGQISSKKRNM